MTQINTVEHYPMLGEGMRHHCVGHRLLVGVTTFSQVLDLGEAPHCKEVTVVKLRGQT